MSFRPHFRDLKEWSETTGGNIKLNTQSNEAAKNYDATLTQLCGWYEDESVGGLEGTRKAMLDADPTFLLGSALDIEISLMGSMTSPDFDQQLAQKIRNLNNLLRIKSNTKTTTELELMHVEVVNYWAENKLKYVASALERLITKYPEDVSALKMHQDMNFMLGTAVPMKNSLSYSLSRMHDKNPLKGYVHGMYSFALEELNIFDKAQIEANKALEKNPRDTWAIHNYAHCLEMQAKVEDGLKWMKDKKCDWLPCQMLACHQYWHTALFHINNNELDEAVALLETEILTRCESSKATSLDVHDAASMLFRMELAKVFDKTSRKEYQDKSYRRSKLWRGVYDKCKSHVNDHLWGFNDVHYMMAYIGFGDVEELGAEIAFFEKPCRTEIETLLNAMYSFAMSDYRRCSENLQRIRHDIKGIGGSNAQRDVFEQLLIRSSLLSGEESYYEFGKRLLLERDEFYGRRLKLTELLAEDCCHL